jgi:hypothetical protein
MTLPTTYYDTLGWAAGLSRIILTAGQRIGDVSNRVTLAR